MKYIVLICSMITSWLNGMEQNLTLSEIETRRLQLQKQEEYISQWMEKSAERGKRLNTTLINTEHMMISVERAELKKMEEKVKLEERKLSLQKVQEISRTEKKITLKELITIESKP